MILKPFRAEDYYQLDQEEGRGLEVWVHEDQIPNTLLTLEANGLSRSVWFGDKLYAIFGMLEIRNGVAEVYFMPSKCWVEKKKSICKAIKEDLVAITKLFNRIQMTCLEDDSFVRFSQFFGFEKEGSLKHYDKFGRTYSMLAITGGII